MIAGRSKKAERKESERIPQKKERVKRERERELFLENSQREREKGKRVIKM